MRQESPEVGRFTAYASPERNPLLISGWLATRAGLGVCSFGCVTRGMANRLPPVAGSDRIARGTMQCPVTCLRTDQNKRKVAPHWHGESTVCAYHGRSLSACVGRSPSRALSRAMQIIRSGHAQQAGSDSIDIN